MTTIRKLAYIIPLFVNFELSSKSRLNACLKRTAKQYGEEHTLLYKVNNRN